MVSKGKSIILEKVRAYVESMARGGPCKDELESKKVAPKSVAATVAVEKSGGSPVVPAAVETKVVKEKKKAKEGFKMITMTEKFNCRAKDLYEILMDENRWKGFTQSNAKISKDVNGEISVFDGSVTGMNLELDEGKLIVQKWRFGSWPDGLDSTVKITFDEPEPGVTIVNLTHTDVPEEDSKTRGMGAGHKLKQLRIRQRWADKQYKKTQLGNEWKKPFANSSHAKGIVLVKADEPLEKLCIASWDVAVQDIEDLKSFAKNQGAAEADCLTHWDITFWSERIGESKYDINEEELRPYFSLPKVMDALFCLAKILFGIDVVPADGVARVWNSVVRFYCVKNCSGNPIAYFYFDPYSRPWMDEVFSLSRVMTQKGSSVRLPVAHMVCNQTPPVGDKPSLMTSHEVETVFHEFGRALQHLHTKEDEVLVAGIQNIEWDAVELPSQSMENLCYHRDTLMSTAKHYQTGETLAKNVYRKLLAERTFRAGSLSLHQFATVDLELHTKYTPAGAEKPYKISHKGNEWKKPFVGQRKRKRSMITDDIEVDAEPADDIEVDEEPAEDQSEPVSEDKSEPEVLLRPKLIYVKEMSKNTRARDVTKFFGDNGIIVKKVRLHPPEKNSRGVQRITALVKLSSLEDTKRAMRLNGHEMQVANKGYHVFMERCRNSLITIFVTGFRDFLEDNTDDDAVREVLGDIFDDYGVLSIFLPEKGSFGYILLGGKKNELDAFRALKELLNKESVFVPMTWDIGDLQFLLSVRTALMLPEFLEEKGLNASVRAPKKKKD